MACLKDSSRRSLKLMNDLKARHSPRGCQRTRLAEHDAHSRRIAFFRWAPDKFYIYCVTSYVYIRLVLSRRRPLFQKELSACTASVHCEEVAFGAHGRGKGATQFERSGIVWDILVQFIHTWRFRVRFILRASPHLNVRVVRNRNVFQNREYCKS